MTKCHFELIAATIAELDFPYDHRLRPEEGTCKRYVAEVFAEALYPTNPRFDAGKFVRKATET
jgi:hypothetical protein